MGVLFSSVTARLLCTVLGSRISTECAVFVAAVLFGLLTMVIWSRFDDYGKRIFGVRMRLQIGGMSVDERCVWIAL